MLRSALVWTLMAALMAEASIRMVLSRKKAPKPPQMGSNGLGPMMDVYGSRVSSRHGDVLYEGMIGLGDMPETQVFKVILDTGSPVLWVPKVGCENDGRLGEYCPMQKHVYDPESSPSEESRDNMGEFKIQYGIGSTLGTYHADTFYLGDPTCNNGSHALRLKRKIEFGAATQTIDGDQGILGLSFPSRSLRGSSIFGQAIADGLMDHPVFTLIFQKCQTRSDECQNGGMVTFGEEDTEHCEPPLGYARIHGGATHWEFDMDGISIGKYKHMKRVKAISDSGSSHLFAPEYVVHAIRDELGAKEENGQLVLPCTTQFNIELTINGTQYQITQNEALIKYSSSACRLALGISPTPQWILGDPWVRTYCQFHYWTDRMIGFGKPKRRVDVNTPAGNWKQTKPTKIEQPKPMGKPPSDETNPSGGDEAAGERPFGTPPSGEKPFGSQPSEPKPLGPKPSEPNPFSAQPSQPKPTNSNQQPFGTQPSAPTPPGAQPEPPANNPTTPQIVPKPAEPKTQNPLSNSPKPRRPLFPLPIPFQVVPWGSHWMSAKADAERNDARTQNPQKANRQHPKALKTRRQTKNE